MNKTSPTSSQTRCSMNKTVRAKCVFPNKLCPLISRMTMKKCSAPVNWILTFCLSFKQEAPWLKLLYVWIMSPVPSVMSFSWIAISYIHHQRRCLHKIAWNSQFKTIIMLLLQLKTVKWWNTQSIPHMIIIVCCVFLKHLFMKHVIRKHGAVVVRIHFVSLHKSADCTSSINLWNYSGSDSQCSHTNRK